MTPSQIYIAISLVVLIVIAVLVLTINRKKEKKLSPIAALAFAFVLAGSVFGGDDRVIGYGLIGVGIFLAVMDVLKKSRSA